MFRCAKISLSFWIVLVVLCAVIVVGGCRTMRVVRSETSETLSKRIRVDELLTHPFVHSARLDDFRTELPTVRPVRMLFQPQRGRTEQDTLYQFDLPEESKIILYRSFTGRELFMAATIGTSSYSLFGGIRAGMSRDSLCARIVDLPFFVGDTLRLMNDSLPFEVDFYFKSGVLSRFQVLGHKSALTPEP